ncbi:hypothetical protein GCM10008090_28360 [Arenicella chitinivorans]|uniref:Methyltransferase domain-containing protein n=1 Tax=Arenicella chitinivorans TaxID=1329800 RepID=A0A918S154_9GAMM|nr:class I SAM-dependent methyltransferase [Arenicella chitinivorans]GHA17008.1 hypothetical protein GCM10008090_28360 [Arenicella chitinivorans]
MSQIADLNGLVQNAAGVYQAPGAAADFNYSDGESVEIRLRDILTAATDLSSDSDELQAAIEDWPTEYHLSQSRANLVRALNLSGVKRVLELGCGCGSITRYLGEQSGLEVDAVEGSPIRAALAKLRCRDLDSVTIHAGNFNQLEFPIDQYDLVLFVGVTEYAGRFSDKASDQEALQDLLALARGTAKSSGVTLVAIENRLGMKYLLGANEDHYGVRFVGLDQYQDSSGIRTYSYAEWCTQIERADYSAHQFLYPFPDYKVPTVVLPEQFDMDDAVTALEGLKSRDYVEAFDLGESEHRLWQGLLQTDSLKHHTNSFLLLLGNDARSVQAMAPDAVNEFPNPDLAYRHAAPEPTPAQVFRKREIMLNAEIAQLQSHTANLEAKVSLMSRSLGWRALNLVRRLFGKTTIE